MTIVVIIHIIDVFIINMTTICFYYYFLTFYFISDGPTLSSCMRKTSAGRTAKKSSRTSKWRTATRCCYIGIPRRIPARPVPTMPCSCRTRAIGWRKRRPFHSRRRSSAREQFEYIGCHLRHLIFCVLVSSFIPSARPVSSDQFECIGCHIICCVLVMYSLGSASVQ